LLQSLSRTWVVQRLKGIDLSVVPRWLYPLGSTETRYQHSLGVGRLSLLISNGIESDQLLLTAAAVLHDVGNGPFPHISDSLMEEMLGFKHEGAVRFAFENSPVRDSLILQEYGLDLDEISSVINGGHSLTPFVNGHVDLDNVDNVYRFISTIPESPLGRPSYSPSEIVRHMSLETKQIKIPEELKARFYSDRQKIYRYLWENRLNMIAWTMLGRAIRIQRHTLTAEFLRMTNREAYRVIGLKLPGLTKALKNKEFKIVLDKKYRLLRGKGRKLLDNVNLGKSEGEFCSAAGLKDWQLGVTVAHLPIGEKRDHWRVYLVVHQSNSKAKEILEDVLSSSATIAA